MSTPELLLVVVDASPAAWSPLDACASEPYASRRQTFPEFVATLQTFLGAFLALHRRNRVVAIAFNGERGGFIVLPPRSAPVAGVVETTRVADVSRDIAGGLWALRYGAAGAAVQEMVDEAAGSAEQLRFSERTPSLTACLALGMCYALKSLGEGIGGAGDSGAGGGARFVIFQAGADAPAHYVSFNNCVSAAAARKILIDSCVMGSAQSVFLQQAAQATSAQHLHPHESAHAGLLEELIVRLLNDAATRGQLLLPPAHSVSHLAHCFCHQRATALGWLCISCLSVWCTDGPCATCGGNVKPQSGSSAS